MTSDSVCGKSGRVESHDLFFFAVFHISLVRSSRHVQCKHQSQAQRAGERSRARWWLRVKRGEDERRARMAMFTPHVLRVLLSGDRVYGQARRRIRGSAPGA